MLRRCALAVTLAMAVGAVATFAAPPGDKGPYEKYPELYEQAKAVVSGQGDAKAATAAIDAELAKVVLMGQRDQRLRDDMLQQLFTLRGAVTTLAPAKDKDVVAVLLDNPQILGRFLHALDAGDNVPKAVGVLKQLKETDEAKFLKNSEFCIAFAVVWDDFHGYHWVDKTCGPVSAEHMLGLYKWFYDNARQMIIKPWDLPFELSVYVVHSRITPEERGWVLNNYGRKLDAYEVYKGVPWTKVLSPAHGAGAGIPYTLANMKTMGGVCMEQAYFTEQVMRLHGVPAVYMRGEGREEGGHAWVGVFLTRPRPQWDFSPGRYRDNRYFLGSSYDPTDTNSHGNYKAPMLLEADIKMTAAALASAKGSLTTIEQSNVLLDAAAWAGEHMGETVGDEDKPITRDALVESLADEALRVNSFNAGVWALAARLAHDKKLTGDQAMDWAKKLADKTLKSFPDYTVAYIGQFLDCADNPDLKIKLYGRLYDELKKEDRADLASNVKVAEGDLWQAKGDVRRAMQCYIYPLVNFSQDNHVLGLAQEKLKAVGAEGNKDETVKACKEILKALDKGETTPERMEAARIINEKMRTIGG
ncbi:MAG: hypothetical protein JXL80_17685 [Planctomycetes bacterium]|nr:hypothetical protein [Planctomycetota bacterium]